jgi:hypothetical protein
MTRLRFLAGIAITCAMTVAWSARVHQDVAAQAPKPITVTRIYAGSDGRTHAEETQLALKRGGSGSEQSNIMAVDSLRFARTPPNQVSDWHSAANAATKPRHATALAALCPRGAVTLVTLTRFFVKKQGSAR